MFLKYFSLPEKGFEPWPLGASHYIWINDKPLDDGYRYIHMMRYMNFVY